MATYFHEKSLPAEMQQADQDVGMGADTCGGVGGMRDKGVLCWHHLLAHHGHLQRAMRQPRAAQAQHRALIPLGRPDLLDGAP